MTRPRTFRALSALLSYPTSDLREAAMEIGRVLVREPALSGETRLALECLTEDVGTWGLYDLQERYVALFDRSRSLSLDLFEHVHGESRDRGGAMVDLLDTYRAAGFEPAGRDLPDHLPVLLEFLSLRPAAEAQAILADAAHIFAALATRLKRRESAYAALFDALGELAADGPNEAALAAALAEPEDDPDDLAALDAAWEEAAVTFGPDPSAGCPVSRDLLARMDVPAANASQGG